MTNNVPSVTDSDGNVQTWGDLVEHIAELLGKTVAQLHELSHTEKLELMSDFVGA